MLLSALQLLWGWLKVLDTHQDCFKYLLGHVMKQMMSWGTLTKQG